MFLSGADPAVKRTDAHHRIPQFSRISPINAYRCKLQTSVVVRALPLKKKMGNKFTSLCRPWRRNHTAKKEDLQGFELVTPITRVSCITRNTGAAVLHNFRNFGPNSYQDLLHASTCNISGDTAVIRFIHRVLTFFQLLVGF